MEQHTDPITGRHTVNGIGPDDRVHNTRTGQTGTVTFVSLAHNAHVNVDGAPRTAIWPLGEVKKIVARHDRAGQIARGPNFGRASAVKRGRDPRWPYVPVIDYGDDGGHARTKQVPKRAYATRAAAVACAQRVIDRNIALHETSLATPRDRALREQFGFPRDLIGVAVIPTDPDPGQPPPVGTVVKTARTANVQERAEGAAQLGVHADLGLQDCCLVEWPDGLRWHRPEQIRLVREPASDAE